MLCVAWRKWVKVGQAVVLLSLVFLLSVGSVLRAPVTPVGVQCPTASVQQIQVAVRDCCGKIVRYETRTPKAGEKAFLQCRCAEKRSAELAGQVGSKRFDCVAPSVPQLAAVQPQFPALPPTTPRPLIIDGSLAPPTPPPA